jgi:hypothetical protein
MKNRINIASTVVFTNIIILILGKKPAHWASVNNAVYLCLDCSGEHRGLGVSISYVRSVTLDSW